MPYFPTAHAVGYFLPLLRSFPALQKAEMLIPIELRGFCFPILYCALDGRVAPIRHVKNRGGHRVGGVLACTV